MPRPKQEPQPCPHCGQPMRATVPTEAKEIMRDGVLKALEEGPATAGEIEARMGVRLQGVASMVAMLKALERRGKVTKVYPADRPWSKGHAYVWALP